MISELLHVFIEEEQSPCVPAESRQTQTGDSKSPPDGKSLESTERPPQSSPGRGAWELVAPRPEGKCWWG